MTRPKPVLRPYSTAVNNAMIYLTDCMLQCLRGLSFHAQVTEVSSSLLLSAFAYQTILRKDKHYETSACIMFFSAFNHQLLLRETKLRRFGCETNFNPKISAFRPNVVVEWLTLLLRMRQVMVSIFGPGDRLSCLSFSVVFLGPSRRMLG
jgi:hypothetical protein